MLHAEQVTLAERLFTYIDTGDTATMGAIYRQPVDEYVSPAFAAREQERLFRARPLCVGLSGLLDRGAYATHDLSGLPLLLSRDTDGAFRALNVCRHRCAPGRGLWQSAATGALPCVGLWTDGQPVARPEDAAFAAVPRAQLGLRRWPRPRKRLLWVMPIRCVRSMPQVTSVRSPRTRRLWPGRLSSLRPAGAAPAHELEAAARHLPRVLSLLRAAPSFDLQHLSRQPDDLRPLGHAFPPGGRTPLDHGAQGRCAAGLEPAAAHGRHLRAVPEHRARLATRPHRAVADLPRRHPRRIRGPALAVHARTGTSTVHAIGTNLELVAHGSRTRIFPSARASSRAFTPCPDHFVRHQRTGARPLPCCRSAAVATAGARRRVSARDRAALRPRPLPPFPRTVHGVRPPASLTRGTSLGGSTSWTASRRFHSANGARHSARGTFCDGASFW